MAMNTGSRSPTVATSSGARRTTQRLPTPGQGRQPECERQGYDGAPGQHDAIRRGMVLAGIHVAPGPKRIDDIPSEAPAGRPRLG